VRTQKARAQQTEQGAGPAMIARNTNTGRFCGKVRTRNAEETQADAGPNPHGRKAVTPRKNSIDPSMEFYALMILDWTRWAQHAPRINFTALSSSDAKH